MDDTEVFIDKVNEEITEMNVKGQPLKKAKYSWQIAGAGSQLKADGNIIQKVAATTIISTQQSEISSTQEMIPIGNLNVNERLKDTDVDEFDGNKKDATTESSLHCVRNNVNKLTCNITQMSNGTVEINLLSSYSLHRWQTKQMAQGIIDNAINNVLGDMGGINSLPRNDEADFAYNRVDPIMWGHYTRTQNIENEGVVEAIRQRGLQKQLPSNIELQLKASADVAHAPIGNPTRQIDQYPLLPSISNNAINPERITILENAKSESENIITTAVSCAINQKGLGVLGIMEQ